MRRATFDTSNGTHQLNISIHALLAESDDGVLIGGRRGGISIHALLAESDIRAVSYTHLDVYKRQGFYRAVEKPSMSLILTIISLGTRVFLSYTCLLYTSRCV